MPVCTPAEGYARVVRYAQHKSHIGLDRFILQSFMAGFWVAAYGHCCTVFASYFAGNPGLAKLAYGALFPGAFVAVALTGTELFTGNSMAMMMYLLNGPKKYRLDRLKAALRVLGLSLVGNIIGAVVGAWFLSYCSGVFTADNPSGLGFIETMGRKKADHSFLGNFVLAVGCNMMVCLATWCTIIIDDGAGKILAMWFTVAVFAVGGFEHIIANFYTLSLYLMVRSKPNLPGFVSVLVYNWIPVFLGNVVAGFIVTALTWWYAFAPGKTRSLDLGDDPLLNKLEKKNLLPKDNRSNTLNTNHVIALSSATSIEGSKTPKTTLSPEEP